MTSLKELQRLFAADLWSDETHQLNDIVCLDEIATERRVNVYRNNFRASLRNALASFYPVVERLVGSEFFGYLAEQYTTDYPSRCGNLQGFGRNMPEFLVNFEAVASIPYLVDVAILECAYADVSRAPLPDPANLEFLTKFASHELPDLRFELGSGCRFVVSAYPLFSIWKVNQDGYVGDDSVSLEEGSQTILIVRPKEEVELRRLGEVESAFVGTLVSGKTLGAAVDVMTLAGYDFQLESLLERYVRSGFLVLSNLGKRSNGY